MFGGLNKSISRLALVAAAGVLSTNAFAADLGGDCCADLEERVAELEATTARKGTRKTTLEIYGQVDKLIVGWNDGINRNVAIGTDNVNSSTRFGLRGSAKVTPTFSAGYSILIEVQSGARSSNGLGQFADVATAAGITNTALGPNQFGANDAALAVREANWYVQSSTLGKIAVGRFNTGAYGSTGTIDLGGIALIASPSGGLIGGAMVFRTNGAAVAPGAPGTGNYSRYSLTTAFDGGSEWGARFNGIGYTSPTIAGFSLTAGAGGSLYNDSQCGNATCTQNFEYGPVFQGSLRYAGEFSGVRVAASAAIEDIQNRTNVEAAAASTAAGTVRGNTITKSFALSLLHAPTGLFAQGSYFIFDKPHDGTDTFSSNDTARFYEIQGGISKNYFGLGNTSPYVEYGRTTNGYNAFSNPTGTPTTAGVDGGAIYAGDNTNAKFYGLGINQDIDAAAMKIFLGYRDFSISSTNCAIAGGCKDIRMLTTGANIKF